MGIKPLQYPHAIACCSTKAIGHAPPVILTDRRPGVVTFYRIWCAAFVALYLGFCVTEILAARGTIEPNFGLISNAAGRPAGSARLIQLGGVPANTNINFDAELPSYDIGNLRWGFGTDTWEAALFVNNLWDERAFLSIDRERGRSARLNPEQCSTRKSRRTRSPGSVSGATC